MRYATFLLPLVLLAASGHAQSRQSPDPEVHITHVEGPLSRRTLRSWLSGPRFRDCQSTFMGGSLRMTIHATPEGSIAIDSVQCTEEVAVYVPCVRRVIAALSVDRGPTPTSARVAILFPALGLSAPAPLAPP